jgi:amino acid adenylation domain-containing protein
MLRAEVTHSTGTETIEPGPAGTPVPLAPSQHQIWLHSRMAPEVPFYNESFTIRRHGPIDRGVMERSFRELLRRHTILRTTFTRFDDQVVQTVHDDYAIQIPYSDLSSLPEHQREAEAIRLATRDAELPFDLSAGPLVRPRLVRLGEDEYRFHLSSHHLIFDGVAACHVLLPELATIYDAFSMGNPSPLPAPYLQYSDFAFWQKRVLQDDSTASQIAYWRQMLTVGEATGLQLPADRPRPAVPTFRGGTEVFSFPAGLMESVKRVAREEGVTTYMLLMACFHTLLHRYSGQEDLMVGGITDGRRRTEFENLMGTFTNTVVLRTSPRGEMTFREFLRQVKELVLDAMANADVPFDWVVRDLKPKREASYNPFYQVIFSVDPPPQKRQHAGWELEQLGIDTGASKCDLFVALHECRNGMIGRFQYSSDLFDRRTVRRMTGHWLALLESVVAKPGAKLRDLTVMTPAEMRELTHGRNDTVREIPDLTIHELIERQVELTPDAIAVEAAGVCLSYRELNERANRLARRLQSVGVRQDTLVAVFLDRTIDLILAPLAVLKAGGAYLPLDPGFPNERLAYLIEDASAAVLLVGQGLEDRLPPTGARLLYCNDLEDGAANLTRTGTPESLAYVRYTSGSTGRPKGVEIPHRALVNLLISMQREPGFTRADSLLAITTHSFDISELELYLPLISGGRLVIAARDDVRDSRRLVRCLLKSGCTVLQATPAAWRGLIDAGWSGQANLKALCGGEALPRDLAEVLLPRVGELWNVYGPTETTVWSSVQRVTSGPGPVPIGRPIDNTQMYVLDAYQNLAPTGATGELYIGGAGVARGYLRREESMQRFVPNPFRPSERMYRTGDVARWLPDGTLECLGRVDNQVKIRGFRIEPGEIETVLGRHEAVGQCVVIGREDTRGDLRLVAYIESQAESAPAAGELRAHLKKELPEYMVPTAFVRMDKLPLTPNGKIDRKALPAPEELVTEIPEDVAPPLDLLEQTLARAWAKVLNVKQVGIRDDFFELGGHSLAAVRLLLEIQSATGRALPLATLFQASTVEALANVLRKDGWTPSWSSLVPIQPLGSKRPLFLAHGAEGNVLLYRQLIQHLGPDQPVYGLQSRGLNGDGHFDATIRDIAAHYVKEIVAVQPDGPYAIGGYCLGGTIAYEMAQQLTASGKYVGCVVMLDTYNNSVISRSRAVLQTPLRLLQNAWFHYANAASLCAKDREKFLSEKWDITITRAGIRLQAALHALRRLGKQKTQHQYPHLILKRINDQAAMEYEPAPYRGRVAVIRSKGSFIGFGSPSLGWEELVGGGLEIHELPIYAKGMLIEPFCRSLAQVLNQILAVEK